MWATGRPMSDRIRLRMLLAAGVKRMMRNWWSTNTVPMPVPASRLFMSLLARDRSATMACSSLLTVASSSLVDCSSSLDVSSSSLVDCSSSLTDCISSFDDLSSSVVRCNSSALDRAMSSWASSSALSAVMRASTWRAEPSPAVSPAVSGASGAALSGASSSTTRNSGASGVAPGPDGTTRMPRLTLVKWPLVFTRRPGTETLAAPRPARRSAVVSGPRRPSRAILRMLLVPVGPGLGSRNMPLRPCR